MPFVLKKMCFRKDLPQKVEIDSWLPWFASPANLFVDPQSELTILISRAPLS